MDGRLAEQMVRPDVASRPPVAVVFMCRKRFWKARKRIPLEFTRSFNAGLNKGFFDQLASFLGFVVVVAGEDDRGDAGPGVGGVSVKANNAVVLDANKRRRIGKPSFRSGA